LPDYVGALKYIEVDTEISNYYLNSIKNGFTAQTHIQLFKGIPTPEEARATARRFKENYQGTDNAGGLIIQYNDPTEKESVINNLQPSDFDKQFDLLNKTVQQEIFVAHKVNSPMLFGVRVEGQLGGRSELIEAYEMFHHAYIEPRQQKIDDTFAYLLEPIASVRLETINKPPIGLDYQALFTAGVITNEEARKELGLPLITDVKQSSLNDAINALSPLVANNVLSNMTINEKRQLANLPPIAGGDALPSAAPVALSKQNPFGWDDERDIKVFQQYGESADNFEAYKFEFVDAVETAILNVLKENKGLQVGDIVNITKLDAKVVADAIAKLAKAELIKSYEDGLETTPKGVEEVKRLETEIVVRYRYGLAAGIQGALVIDTTRDFCRQIAESNRVYSREDINAMSTQLGYDVWKRRGGWYHNPVLDVNTPQCRHIWVQQLLRRIKR
jgi:predicted transcriptional regulator